MGDVDDFLTGEHIDEQPVDLGPETYAMVQRAREIVWAHDNAADRSQQKAAGPSEIGDPCERKIAYKSIGFTPCNHESDHWAAIVGTSVHAWLADAYTRADNGSGRFLIEYKMTVTLPSGLVVPGHLDVYDRLMRELVDHKVVGPQAAEKYRRNGAPQGYRVQGQIYAKGLEQAGERPLRVGQIYYPRLGKLADAFGFAEPYTPHIAEQALSRYEYIHTEANRRTDGGKNPAALIVVPKTPSFLCSWCSYYMPDSPSVGKGCSGKGRDK